MSDQTARVIDADSVYEKAEFLRRTNLKQAGWRTARQNGLKVAHIHGRCYVKGSDWAAYLDAMTAEPAEASA